MSKIIKLFTEPKLNLILSVAFIALVFTKPIDIGYHLLGLSRSGEFTGFIFRFVDFSVLYSSYWVLQNVFNFRFIELKKLFKLQTNFNFFDLKTLRKLMFIGFSIFLLFYWLSINLSTWFSFKNGFLYLIALSLGASMLYRYKPVYLLILVPYFLFDHILISSTFVLQMWLLLGIFTTPLFKKYFSQKNTKYFDFAIPVLLFLNLCVAIFQIYSGHSFGLYWLGESKLDVNVTGGIAKQILPFLNQTILRGYGLLPHPNILGFLSIFLILSIDQIYLLSNQNSKKINLFYALGFLALMSVTFSRMAFLSILIYFGYKIFTKFNHFKKLKIIFNLLCIFSISLIFITGALTRNTSDFYRLEQHRYLIDLIQKEPLALIIGLGPNQYSNYLKTESITTYLWQNEPFYQPFGNIVVELGLFGVFLMSYTLNKLNQRL